MLNWIEQSEQNGGDEDDGYDGGATTPAECLNDKDGGKNPEHTTTNTADKGESKPKMTPEEAQRKAMELQKKIREKKMMKERAIGP